MICPSLPIDAQNQLPSKYGIGFTDLGTVPGNQADAFSKADLASWKMDLFDRLHRHLCRVCREEHDEPNVYCSSVFRIVLVAVPLSSGCFVLWEESVCSPFWEVILHPHGKTRGAAYRLAIVQRVQGICLSQFKWTCWDEERGNYEVLSRSV